MAGDVLGDALGVGEQLGDVVDARCRALLAECAAGEDVGYGRLSFDVGIAVRAGLREAVAPAGKECAGTRAKLC